MRILLTGGGTGGHIYPALAIAKGLRGLNPKAKLLYVGTQKGLEADLVPREEIDFKAITVEGLPRGISFKSIKSSFKLCLGLMQALGILRRFRPRIIIATGGYVAGPVSWVGAQMKIPLVIHEQNSLPGLTNRLLAAKAKRICLTFEDSMTYFKDKSKLRITGLPIRPEILQADRTKACLTFGLEPDKKTLLITGGSQGAQSINKATVEIIPELVKIKGLQIIFITGKNEYEKTVGQLGAKGINHLESGNITIKPYLHNMELALAIADLIVGRAGAAFIAEITAKGIPAILIPYPLAAANHQEKNAASLVTKGAAIAIKDSELSAKRLLQHICRLISDNERSEAMSKAALSMSKPNALEDILKIINEVLDETSCM